MTAMQSELLGLDVERTEGNEIVRAEAGELIEKLGHGFACAVAELRLSVKLVKGAGVAVLEDQACANQPVCSLPVDEVADNIEGRPGRRAFIGVGPRLGQIAEESVEGSGGAGEYGEHLID